MEKINIGNIEVFAFENGECNWKFKNKSINIHDRILNDKMIKAYRCLVNGDTNTYNVLKSSILIDKRLSDEDRGLFILVDDNFIHPTTE